MIETIDRKRLEERDCENLDIFLEHLRARYSEATRLVVVRN